MSNDILTVQNLSVKLDGNEIIKNISFSVKERDTLVILGPNGAGKTTLLRALLGLVPYVGKVHWRGKRIRYLPPQELINKKTLLPLNVWEFLNFKKVTPTAIKTMIEQVGLEAETINLPLEHLSTGQFQRLLIAWALIDKPDVLLFDEPTAGIDIGGEENVYSLLHNIWKKQILTIILVTHHINVVWKHANSVLCINKFLLCHGTPKQILTKEIIEQVYGKGAKLYEHHHTPE